MEQTEQGNDLMSHRNVPARSTCRPRKLCPVKGCGVSVIHLPRHLRQYHDWTMNDARHAVNTFQLRKTYLRKNSSIKSPKYKDYHRARPCPVEGCPAVVKRLSSHLKCHKIAQHSPLYKELLKAARKRKRSRAVRTGVNSSDRCTTNTSTTVQSTQDEADTDDNGVASGSDMEDMDSDGNDDVEPVDEEEQQDRNVNSNKDAEHEKEVKEFFEWMTSADGGKKHIKSATQHASQVATLITLAQQNNIALWNRSMLDVFSKYAADKRYLPATKKAYLNSLKHYCDFAKTENKVDANLISKMRDRVCLWISSYRKDCGKHQQQRMDTDLGKLVTPQQLTQFRRSQPALSAIKLIGTSSDGLKRVVQGEYVNLRDFLLTEIAMANANRSGVLANMTAKEFQEARVVDGEYVVSVAEHKTALTYGPAKVIMSPTLHQYVAVYCKDVRPQVLPEQQPNELFITWNGAGMSSGQITKSVQRIWTKAGLGNDITLNIVRKTAVSSVHQAHPAMTSNLADLMCHRQSTAQKCYRLIEREHSSVMASKTLAETLAGGRMTEETTVAPGRPTSATQLQGSAAREVEKNGSGDRIMEETSVGPGRQTSAMQTRGLAATATAVSKASVWNETSLLLLRDLFRSEIAANSISIEIVRTKIKESDLLMSIGSRKVYDRIRSDIRKNNKEFDTAPLPEQCETADQRISRMFNYKKKQLLQTDDVEDAVEDAVCDSECVASSTRKDLFSKEDVSAVLKLCAQIIARGPISETRINDELNKTFAGRKLLDKYTSFQIQNRVKYQRRKLSKVIIPTKGGLH